MDQHIGERLRRARESKSLSLDNISQEIYIKAHYLEALEAGEFDVLPSQAQARGFLRMYASYLELDPEEAVAEADQVSPSPEGQVETAQTSTVITASPQSETAEAIFAEIGQALRTQRELLGFSLDDVEQNTHLRVHYLKALEGGHLAALPSPVQGRGMLSNYAKFLGMDADPLLLRFADGLQADLAVRQSTRSGLTGPARVNPPSLFRRLISGDLLFGGVLIVALVAFVVWGAIRISTVQSEADSQPTAPPIAEVLLPTAPPEVEPTATPTANAQVLPQPESVEALDQPTEGPPDQGDVPVQIYIVVRQRAWMQVLVDGKEAFSGRVIPGGAYTFSGDEQVEILTGNGAGLEVYYNQQNLGPLGFYGEVVNKIYSLDGVQDPTPTQTLTPTQTPEVTPTATDVA